MNIWQDCGRGRVSYQRAYEEAVARSYEFDGHTWRMWAESNAVLVVERDGEAHRIKCVLNANPYANLEYQIQRTQVKFARYNAPYLVALIAYGGFKDYKGEWTDEPNYGVASELNDLWRVRPIKEKRC